MRRRVGFHFDTPNLDIRRVTSVRLDARHNRIVIVCEGEPGVVRILSAAPQVRASTDG